MLGQIYLLKHVSTQTSHFFIGIYSLFNHSTEESSPTEHFENDLVDQLYALWEQKRVKPEVTTETLSPEQEGEGETQENKKFIDEISYASTPDQHQEENPASDSENH